MPILKWLASILAGKPANKAHVRGNSGGIADIFDHVQAGDHDAAKSMAQQYARQQAEQGHVLFQCELGLMYLSGNGVEEDKLQAAEWFRKSAEQGYAKAQDCLGLMYFGGHGVQQDNHQAAEWCRKAAEQGYAEAQRSLGIILGTMHLQGENIDGGIQEVYVWLSMAANGGDKEAHENVKTTEQLLTSDQIAAAKEEAARRAAAIEEKKREKQ